MFWIIVIVLLLVTAQELNERKIVILAVIRILIRQLLNYHSAWENRLSVNILLHFILVFYWVYVGCDLYMLRTLFAFLYIIKSGLCRKIMELLIDQLNLFRVWFFHDCLMTVVNMIYIQTQPMLFNLKWNFLAANKIEMHITGDKDFVYDI